jgi:hypothetical protein
VFLVELQLETVSFKTTQLPIWISITSKICNMEVCGTVQAERKCEYIEKAGLLGFWTLSIVCILKNTKERLPPSPLT